jgi:hypothetical protein
MSRISAALLITALASTSAGAQAPAAGPRPAGPLLPRLTDAAIKDAVRQTLAETKKKSVQRDGVVLSGEKYENFARQVDDAKIPDCLHSQGLKFQPTFFLSGLLAAPFVLVAAARGKCH